MKGKINRVFRRRKQTPIRVDSARFAQYSTLQLLKMTFAMAKETVKSFWQKHKVASRVVAIFFALLILFGIFYQIYELRDKQNKYDIAQSEFLLPRTMDLFSDKLQLNDDNSISYNKDYSPSSTDVSGQVSGPKFSAEFGASPQSNVSVTDPSSSLTMKFTPKFGVGEPVKKENRVVYPVVAKNATLVYTAQASRLKEDIILHSFSGKEMEFEYELELADGLEARVEPNGGIGIYGPDGALASGNIATGSEEDAKLLEKAMQNSEKTKLIFAIPAPIIIEATGVSTVSKTWYTLSDNVLTIHASELDKATYPLSIDPTIYIETARKLMRGNNESNIDFDIDNELIQKSQTTGAKIDSWSSTSNLTSAVFGQGTAAAGGFIYSVGGGGSGTPVTTTISSTGTYNVPVGVTSLTIKAWGAGGAGGAGSAGSAAGGNGGGGGFARSTITVTPSETLNIDVGTGGVKGAANSHGGNGGGFSAVRRSGTYLIQAGGGGGGGGTRGNQVGGNGGAGGGASGIAGSPGAGTSPQGGGGGGGNTTTATNGTAGSAGTGGAVGVAGTTNAGGNGSATATSCATATTGTGGNAGTGGGGGRGTYVGAVCSNGGGGGGGTRGGGGGGTTNSNNRGGGGGGGGSSLVTGVGTIETQGSGQTPGSNADSDRAGYGDGGTGATANTGTTAGDNGVVVISYVTPGPMSASVYWAQFNSTTNAIESPNPGNGVCSGWCTSSVYDLPEARQGLSLVAYNGFLYAMGGVDGSGNYESTVFIAKIGANGEPQLWHPSGGTPTYWYTATAMTNPRTQFGAVAYNNRMYIMGGLTTAGAVLSSNTVEVADINPTGTMTAWTTTGAQALGTPRYGLTAQVYNGTIYTVGGNATLGGSPVTTVEYSKLSSNGNMNSWTGTSGISSGRLTVGGSFSAIFGGYMYVAGGCSAVTVSGYCSAVSTDVQLASINADGSLGPWNSILNITNDRFGHTLIAWQGGLYRLGGCRAQDAGSGGCTDTVFDVDFGVINKTGEASTVNSSVASGVAPCNGGSPYSCDLPGVANIGNMLSSSAVYNGYLYIMGGCTSTTASPANGCATVTGNIAYQAIGSDGRLTRPAVCPNGAYVDSYCVDSVNTLPGNRLAASATVFNGRIYVVGGNSAGASDNELNYVSINADGSLASAWTTQTMAGGGTALGATAVSFTYAHARANPAQADTIPGNLFIFGGCTGTAVGCSGYIDDVFKCEILPDGAIGNGSNGGADCTETGQLQIGTIPGAGGVGLAAHAGVVYANYIYLVGGLGNGVADLTTLRYARFDDNNNVVTVSSGWVESPVQMNTGRRRGSGFGYNGYIYVVGGYDATTGVLADIEFVKIDVSDGSIDSDNNLFHISSVTINQRWGLTVAVSNSYAYVIGGCTAGASPGNCTARATSIQTFQIYNNDSGTPVGYSADDLMGTDRFGGSSAIVNGYLFVAGGCISTDDCSNATNNVESAPIDIYGNLGSWTSTTALTQDRAWGQLETAGGSLYFIGGQNDGGTAQTTVYYATPSAGTVSSWGTATQSLPAARTQHSAAVWNNRIYVTGGSTGGVAQSTVYISPPLPTGGDISTAWNSTSATNTSFDVARTGHTTVAYANNLYVLGGHNGTSYLSDTQFASLGYKTGTIGQSGTTITGSGTAFTSGQIGSTIQYQDGSTATITGYTSGTVLTVNISKTVASSSTYNIMDGSVGVWTFSTSLPTPIRQADGFAANGYIYLVGGRSSDIECSPRTLVAPISANTTIATGNNPTGVGQWFETNVRYTGDRYGAAASYANGRTYVTGGACASYPIVDTVQTTMSNTESTTNNVTMPATVEAGDLLLVLLSTDDASTITTPGGWTAIDSDNGTTVTGSIFAKIAAGTEDGTSVNFVTSANQKSAAQAYRILAADWYGTLATGVNVTTTLTSATTATPNPPSLNPASWATEKTLWIAYVAGSTYSSITSNPAGFTDNSHINSTTVDTTGASASSARRALIADSMDPGTFTMNSSQGSVAYTIAIRPPAALKYTTTNRVVQTAVYSQPQIAQYSRMIDTDTDVFPTSWLMNGLDNSVGARWQVKYRSMHDINPTSGGSDSVLTTPPSTYTVQQNPNEDCGTSSTMATMTTWGQDYNHGDVLLGDVASYTAREGGGGNINCARYYYFYVSIDASQTFGYPEDVQRGPTISDLSLFFTSDPSRRLRHGKTFTGGEQQPLDTPCRQSVDAQCPLP